MDQNEEDKRSYEEEKVINEEGEGEEVDMVRVYPEELRGKFNSKLDVYNYLKLKWQLFLPPVGEAKIGKTTSLSFLQMNSINLDYLRGLLSGKYKAIENKDIREFGLPRFEEVRSL